MALSEQQTRVDERGARRREQPAQARELARAERVEQQRHRRDAAVARGRREQRAAERAERRAPVVVVVARTDAHRAVRADPAHEPAARIALAGGEVRGE